MFNINVSPEDVDKFVSQALLQSCIGAKISIAVEKACKDVLDGYNSPIKDIVKKEVSESIKVYLERPEVKIKLQELIAKHITDDKLDHLLSYSLKKLSESILSDRGY